MGRLKLTIDEMQDIAKSRGGKCLSTEYVNNSTKLEWKCKEGHVWLARPNDIKQGKWCPICGIKRVSDKKRLTIEEMQKISRSRGGTCLSTDYINNRTKLQWECKKGHIWLARPADVKNGKWCPDCAGVKKLTIEKMKNIAESKGGKCLSKKYFNSKTKLQWQCSDGHTWEATPEHIIRGQWCSKCNIFIGEKIFRKTLECIFQKPFLKVRPKWLKGNYKKPLELDAYNEKLKLAGEYNGRWHKKKEQKNRDKMKLERCKKLGIVLLTVSACKNYENIVFDIIEQCDIHNVTLPNPVCYIYYENLPIYSYSKIKEMQEIAEKRGGNCLSTEYIDSRTKLQWQCKEGHVWWALPSCVKYGDWCRICGMKRGGKKNRLTIKEMQDIAESRGGKCLSKEYLNNYTKLQWQCKKGHIWWSTPITVKHKKRWCHKCKIKARADKNRKINFYPKGLNHI